MTASEAVREGEAPSVTEAERAARRIARSTPRPAAPRWSQAPAPPPKADTATVKKAAARKLAKTHATTKAKAPPSSDRGGKA